MDLLSHIHWWLMPLFASALFSGMEMAFIATDKLHYIVNNDDKGLLNKILNNVYKRPRRFVSALALGNLAALVFFTYLSLRIFYPYIDTHVTNVPFYNILLIAISIALMVILNGEIIPRIIMARNPDVWIRILIIPSYLFYIVLYPFTFFLDKISEGVLLLLGIKLHVSNDATLNRTDIDNYLRKGIEEMSDSLDIESEVKILRNALEFSYTRVRDCMVPRAYIVATSIDSTKDVVKELFIDTGISRVLVYKDDIDNIIGYIHVWEMFNESNNWHESIAEISFIPESMQANELMNEFMQQHRSIAVVFDEFGGTSGVVTIEDLVEEIFGEIDDEYDDQSKFVKKYTENEFVLSGRVEIDTLNEEFGLNVPESDDYTTIAGFILFHTQRFPRLYETIIIDQFEFKVQKVTSRKIEVVKLLIHSN